jgi:hypothetical protein
MRIAVLAAALLTIVIGVLGIVSPDTLTMIRRMYVGSVVGFYTAVVVRVAMVVVVILFAPHSRAPKTLRALGAVMCLQVLGGLVLGPVRAQAGLEWEAVHPTLMRLGALIALATGAFLAFIATTGRRASEMSRLAH